MPRSHRAPDGSARGPRPRRRRSGRMRSSHFGSHQAAWPSRCMSAGISSIRTTNASNSTPNARPNPSGRTIARCEKTKPPNTATMMIAAAVTTARPLAQAGDDRGAGGRAVHVGLAHARDEEQLVVHRQPEQHADDDDRREVQDGRRGRARRTPVAEPAPLVDRDDARRGRRSSESTKPAGRDERHEERAEHEDQDDQRQADDDREVERQRVGELLGDVDVAAGLARRRRASMLAARAARASRRSCTSCSVDSLDGPSAGTTWKAKQSRSSETPTGATATTSSCSMSALGELDLASASSLVLGDGVRAGRRRRAAGRSARRRTARRWSCRRGTGSSPRPRMSRRAGRGASTARGWR